MKRVVLVAIVAALAVVALASDPPTEDGVVVLGDDTYDDYIAKQPLALVEFYAPWCGHCKNLAPHYAGAAQKLTGKVPLIKIDATVHKKLSDRYSVRGYPTVLVVSDGGKKHEEYEGGRTEDDIVKYMEKQLLPVVTTATTKKDLDEVLKDEKVVAVSFLLGKSADAASAFSAVAQSMRNELRFVAVEDDAVAKAFDVKEPSIVIFKQFDEKKVVKPAKGATKEAISEFIRANDLPLLDDIGPENYKKYVSRRVPMGFVFVDPSQTEQAKTYSAIGTAVASKFRGKVLFSRADGVKYNGHLKNVGLSGKTPFGFGVEDADGKHWVFPEDGEFTEAKLEKFVEGMLSGDVQPTLKSEPIPEKQDGPVKVLVGKNFEKEINESPNDILVEFYAPWCGHCKALAPIYDQLAERLAAVKTVTIAKIDATANDTPGFRIQGFPTLKFIKATDKKNPMAYEGERTLDAMLSFIQANAAHKFDAPEPKDEL